MEVQVALGDQFGELNGVQVALGGEFEGRSGVHVTLGVQLERASASNWAPSESHWAQVGPTGTAVPAGTQPDLKKGKHLTLSNHLKMVLDLL